MGLRIEHSGAIAQKVPGNLHVISKLRRPAARTNDLTGDGTSVGGEQRRKPP
jgi:hypothetical protein